MIYYLIARNRKVLLFMVVVTIIIAGLGFKKEVSSYKEAASEYSDLQEKYVSAPEADADDTEEAVIETECTVETPVVNEAIEETKNNIPELTNVPEMDIDFDSLSEINGDIVAWIYIPAANISYPVVHGEDNNKYLDYDFEGNKSSAGCVYLNSGCEADFSSNNSFVHAHNRADGSMFGKLDETFFWNEASDKNIYVFLADGTVYGYEVTYVYTVSNDSDLFRYADSDKAYGAYLDEVKEVSGSEIDADSSVKMLTLATCYGKGGTTKLLINAMMIGMAN